MRRRGRWIWARSEACWICGVFVTNRRVLVDELHDRSGDQADEGDGQPAAHRFGGQESVGGLGEGDELYADRIKKREKRVMERVKGRFDADFLSYSKIIELQIRSEAVFTSSPAPHRFSYFDESAPTEESLHKRTARRLAMIAFDTHTRMIFSSGSFFIFSFYASFASSISTPSTENTSDNSCAFASWLRKWRTT